MAINVPFPGDRGDIQVGVPALGALGVMPVEKEIIGGFFTFPRPVEWRFCSGDGDKLLCDTLLVSQSRDTEPALPGWSLLTHCTPWITAIFNISIVVLPRDQSLCA